VPLLGEIPEHWIFFVLKRIIKEHLQGFYSEQEYIESGIKLARITDLDGRGGISYKHMPHVDISKTDYPQFMIQAGDFIFARTGASAGDFALIENGEKAVFASYLIRFRFNKGDKIYLKYYFLSKPFLEGLLSSRHGGANQNIHADNIKIQYITFPPLSEQTLIAGFLEKETVKIEKVLRKIQNSIEVLLEYRSTLISAAVTGKIDVREEET
jgi:type I restriction enzyme S subunit